MSGRNPMEKAIMETFQNHSREKSQKKGASARKCIFSEFNA